MRKTKIVCTIGPASESFEKLSSLMEAGMNVCRLNFSHGSHEEHAGRIKTIREAAAKTGKTVAILLDTKGPEIRTNDMENGAVELVTGSHIIISTKEVLGTAEKFSITYPELINDVEIGSKILLDDGLVGLEVTKLDKENGEIHTVVWNDGTLKNKKGVNVPGVSVNLPGITEKDRADILFGIEQNVDFVAASFVRRASDVLEIRELLDNNGGSHINIIPKIENQEGVDYVFNSELDYEFCVTKKHILPLLKEIQKDSPHYNLAASLKKYVKYFRDIEDDMVPANSLLREFIGGSCFKV